MTRHLTPEDIAFVSDPSTYRSGPTFDLTCEAESSSDGKRLLAAVLDDHSISVAAPGLSAQNSGSSGSIRAVWLPADLPAVGVTFLRREALLDMYLYPPHVERATGWPFFAGEAERDPRVHAFHQAAIDLTRRIHRRTPLLRASIMDETWSFNGPETGSIAVLRTLAEAARWPHRLAADKGNDDEPWIALLPLEE